MKSGGKSGMFDIGQALAGAAAVDFVAAARRGPPSVMAARSVSTEQSVLATKSKAGGFGKF